MKPLFLFAIVLLLTGCASGPYDEQFATMKTRDAAGNERVVMWTIGPSRWQAARARAGAFGREHREGVPTTR